MTWRRPMAVLGVAAAVTVSLPLGAAGAAGSAIVNGDFEADAVGSTTVTGWTFVNELVDLGVTSLGGCVSQDTSSYTTLRDYADNADGIFTPEVGAGDELLVPGTTDEVWMDASGAVATTGAPGFWQVFYGTVDLGDGDETTDFYVVDGVDVYLIDDAEDLTGDGALTNAFWSDVYPDYLDIPDPTVRADQAPAGLSATFESATVDADSARDGGLAPSSTALELYSGMSGSPEGYVAHGPAVISEPFTASGNRTVTLDWAASAQSDDYHVLGYALDVNTCQQVEVLDSTGRSSAWQSASVALPAGTYRFVFVAGTYDASWGGAAGAVLYVDNIRVVPTISGTGLDLEPLFGLGDPVANAPIQLTGGGLMPNSAWTAELHSTPVTLATGFTDSSGNFWMLSTLPPTVEPGQHKIILKGTAPDGSPREDVVWITVSASGTIGYVSLVGAEDAGGAAPIATAVLAKTGVESSGAIALGAGLLAAGGAAIVVARRGRRSS